MDSFSIADFAESLISEEVETKGKEKAFSAPAKSAPNERDISEVEVPDSYRSQLVESYLGKDVSPEVPTENIFGNPIQEEDPHDIEVDQAELVNRLQDLISELKGVLTEMTTTGMIGCHVGGLAMRPKKKRILRKKKK